MLVVMTDGIRVEETGVVEGLGGAFEVVVFFLSADFTGFSIDVVDRVAGFSNEANLTPFSLVMLLERFGGMRYPRVRPY